MNIDITKLPPWAKLEITKGDLIAFAEQLKMSHVNVTVKDDEDEFMTMDEAAAFLKLKKQSLYGMTSRKQIKFFKRGKRNYFRKADLIAFIEAGKQSTQSEMNADVMDYLRKNHKKSL